jgi:hypothetical protein
MAKTSATQQEIARVHRLQAMAREHRTAYLARVETIQAVLADLFSQDDTIPRDIVLTALRNRATPNAFTPKGQPSGTLKAALRAEGITSYHVGPEPTGPYAAYSHPKRGIHLWSTRSAREVFAGHTHRLDLT